jgi:hypothetical protein
MQPLLLFFIIFVVIIFLGVGLFYVGTKLLYNITTDISNSSVTSAVHTLPVLPTGTNNTNNPTLTTTPLTPNNLECWTQSGYQGTVTLTPLSSIQPNSANLFAIESSTKSIRYPSIGYEVYIYYSTIPPVDSNIIKQNGSLLSPDTPTLPIVNQTLTRYIAIFNIVTTTTNTTTTTIPSNVFRVWTGTKYTGLYKDIPISSPIYEYGFNYIEPRFSNTSIKSIQIFGTVHSMGRSDVCDFSLEDKINQYDMSQLDNITDDPLCIWYT